MVAQCRDGFPELCAVAAHDRAPERRFPPASRNVASRARDRREGTGRPALVNLSDYGDRRPVSSRRSQQRSRWRERSPSSPSPLLDEPLSNLDAKLRVQMRNELRSLQRKLAITTIFVTHDQSEAMTTADRIAVRHHGVIQPIGTPWISSTIPRPFRR